MAIYGIRGMVSEVTVFHWGNQGDKIHTIINILDKPSCDLLKAITNFAKDISIHCQKPKHISSQCFFFNKISPKSTSESMTKEMDILFLFFFCRERYSCRVYLNRIIYNWKVIQMFLSYVGFMKMNAVRCVKIRMESVKILMLIRIIINDLISVIFQ